MDPTVPRDGTLHDLVEGSPEATLLATAAAGGTGTVVLANRRAVELLGADPVGHDVSEVGVVPGRALEATTLDGRAVLLDVVVAPVRHPDGPLLAVFLEDSGERLANERCAARLHDSEVRRLQALERADALVQSLTAASQLLEHGETARALERLDQALGVARGLIDDWLVPLEGDLAPGDLVRSEPSGPARSAVPPDRPPVAGSAARARVLVADDDRELRELFVMQLEAEGDLEVVGQARDGREAVQLAAELAPDVVLLDLAMPVMDGLQALPLILRQSPGTRVVVVSAFDEEGLGGQAVALGAVRYVEKGLAMRLPDVVRAVLVG